jgi:hypothetical protein
VPSTDPAERLAGYERWLESQPLAPATRRAYRGHARRFVEFLASWPGEGSLNTPDRMTSWTVNLVVALLNNHTY